MECGKGRKVEEEEEEAKGGRGGVKGESRRGGTSGSSWREMTLSDSIVREDMDEEGFDESTDERLECSVCRVLVLLLLASCAGYEEEESGDTMEDEDRFALADETMEDHGSTFMME